jgi:hypothetical protein
MAARTLALGAVLLACLLGGHAQQPSCITPYQSCLNNDDLSYAARALNVRPSWLSSWDLPHADAHAVAQVTGLSAAFNSPGLIGTFFVPKNEAWSALLQLVGLTADQALSEQSSFMPFLGQVDIFA